VKIPVNPDGSVAGEKRKTKKTRRLEILRFSPGDSFLHRLDPRTKLLALLIVSILALLFSGLAGLVLVLLFELFLAITSGLGKKFLQALTLVLPLFIIVLVLDSFFSKNSSGPVYFSAQIGFLHPELTTGGILFATAMAFRLLVLAGISVLFLMTTSHDDFARSLRTMRVPPTLTFSLGYALRSITTLTEDSRHIMDAQRSRGLELDRGNVIGNRNKLVALFVPATVSMLNHSKQTADAMQARGFCPSATQSCYRSQKLGKQDGIMCVTLVSLTVVVFALNLFFTA
jgi:energy-coupling factor transport system permease protein